LVGLEAELWKYGWRLHRWRPYPHLRRYRILVTTVDPDNLPRLHVSFANQIIPGANPTRSGFTNARGFTGRDDKINDISGVVAQLDSRVVEASFLIGKRNVTPLIELSGIGNSGQTGWWLLAVPE
jgi:hypothetical protein